MRAQALLLGAQCGRTRAGSHRQAATSREIFISTHQGPYQLIFSPEPETKGSRVENRLPAKALTQITSLGDHPNGKRFHANFP